MKDKGVSFVGLLQIVFIVLKLCKVITWNWFLVFLPTIICIAITIVALIILYILDEDK